MEKIIVLAGGSGSRLWPYSRKNYPKQVLKLFEDESLLQKTILRFKERTPKENIHIITNNNQSHLIKSNVEEINFSHDDLIIEEPFAKNTAGAICLAALQLNDDDIMIVLPSDHIIQNETYFLSVLDEAVELAQQDFLVTLGIQPTYPETGYGYIKKSDLIKNNGYSVECFTEKPNLKTAKTFVDSGDYFWNSGMFVWKVSTILSEFKNIKPQLHDHIKKFVSTGDARHFYGIEDISIDYAILEQSKCVAVVKADLEWSDLGSWKSVYDIQKKDKNGNVFNGDCVGINTQNVFIHNTSDARTVAAVDIENIAIIDTDDAVIVCNTNETQNVKKVVDQLKKEKSEKVEFHKTVYRPWGYFKVLEDTDYFKSKRLVIYPGQSISLQYHTKRNETWTVVKGTASVIRGDETLELMVGETVYIPAGYKHRLTNNSNINVEIIEVQTGTYFGEDDIIRLEDQYKRI